MDPRFKLQYYKDNKWEDSFIQEAKNQVVEVWSIHETEIILTFAILIVEIVEI